MGGARPRSLPDQATQGLVRWEESVWCLPPSGPGTNMAGGTCYWGWSNAGLTRCSITHTTARLRKVAPLAGVGSR